MKKHEINVKWAGKDLVIGAEVLLPETPKEHDKWADREGSCIEQANRSNYIGIRGAGKSAYDRTKGSHDKKLKAAREAMRAYRPGPPQGEVDPEKVKADAIKALMKLGYSESEATKLVDAKTQ
jgi:hypothetical protein